MYLQIWTNNAPRLQICNDLHVVAAIQQYPIYCLRPEKVERCKVARLIGMNKWRVLIEGIQMWCLLLQQNLPGVLVYHGRTWAGRRDNVQTISSGGRHLCSREWSLAGKNLHLTCMCSKNNLACADNLNLLLQIQFLKASNLVGEPLSSRRF